MSVLSPGGTPPWYRSTDMRFDTNRKVQNCSPGSKFLVIRRLDEGKTMVGVSPFLVNRCLKGVGGSPLKMTLLRDGNLLVLAKDMYQAQKYIQLIAFNSDVNVEISEHSKFNKVRGVIRCRELIGVSDDEFLSEMKDQFVTEIYRLKKKENDKEIELGTYFISFSTTRLPEYLDIGYLKVRVSPYTPNPMRCWNCLQFNHLKTSCKAKARICGNCGDEFHLIENERCQKPPKCVNCFGDHSSFDKNCPIYIKNKEINRIKVTELVSFNEASKIFAIRNPMFNRRDYANALTNQNTPSNQSTQPTQNHQKADSAFKIPQIPQKNRQLSKSSNLTISPSVSDYQKNKKSSEKNNQGDIHMSEVETHSSSMNQKKAPSGSENTKNEKIKKMSSNEFYDDDSDMSEIESPVFHTSRSRTRKQADSPKRNSRSRSPIKTRSQTRAGLVIKDLIVDKKEAKKYDSRVSKNNK